MNRTSGTTVWVEKLGVIDIVIFFIRSLFGNLKVYYDEYQVTSRGNAFLSFSRRLNCCKNFLPASLSFDGKDSKGFSLSYQVEENLDTCIEGFCNKYLKNESERFKKMATCYLAAYLLQRITFITMVEARIVNLKNLRHEILCVRHPVNSLIMKFYESRGVKIRQSYSFKGYLKILARPFCYLLITLYSQLLGRKVKSNIKEIKPAVWVQYEGEASKRKVMVTGFWRKHVKANDFDIVYSFDRRDRHVTRETIDDCAEQGVKWIDCQKVFNIGTLTFRNIIDLFLNLMKFIQIQPFWFHFVKLGFNVMVMLYASIYKRYKVKILIQHLEYNWKQEVQAQALESAGGIMLGFHWSRFDFYLDPNFLTPQHVYFVWGKDMYELLKKKGNTCRYILPCGLTLLPDGEKNPSKNIELSDAVDFVIAIFDSTVAYNIYLTPNTLSQFYLKLIRFIEINSNCGGIIKSKAWDIEELSFLPQGSNIVSRLNELIEQKRVVGLSPKDYPIIASSYANLTVCYSINTAGIEAGVLGHRVIHWDCCGFGKHPFYKDREQSFIYASLDELENAIFKVMSGDRKIGDFSKYRRHYNHFEDNLAPKRVGKFIQSYMEGIGKADNGFSYLDLMVNKYIQENNIGHELFEFTDWWGHESTK